MNVEPNEVRPSQTEIDREKRSGKSLDGLNYQPSKGYMPTANPKTDDSENHSERHS